VSLSTYQRTDAGVLVEPGYEVWLTFERAGTLVPFLLGLTKAQALQRLQAASLNVGSIDTKYLELATPGIVNQSSYAPNLVVELGTPIDITLTRATP